MKLSQKIKTALDETRMLILGAQILLGFQLRAAFSERFDELSAPARYLDCLSLGCLICVLALLIAPNPYHRFVENGDDSGDFHELVTTFADAALLPFALALGLDLFVVIEGQFGLGAAIASGSLATAVALIGWYGVPWLAKQALRGPKRRTRMPAVDKRQPTPIHTKIEQTLTEARVIIPGAQAVLGFQLSIVLTRAFDQLSPLSRTIHAVCIALITLSVILLMAPAAYHRIVHRGEDTQQMYRIASGLITAATAPLALGLAGDVYVVIAKIAGSTVGVAAGIAGAVLMLGLWYAYPVAIAVRGHRSSKHRINRAGRTA